MTETCLHTAQTTYNGKENMKTAAVLNFCYILWIKNLKTNVYQQNETCISCSPNQEGVATEC